MSSHLPHNTLISLNTIPAIHPTVQVVVGQDAIDHTQPGSQAHCGENNCSSAQYRPACCLDSIANTPFILTNRRQGRVLENGPLSVDQSLPSQSLHRACSGAGDAPVAVVVTGGVVHTEAAVIETNEAHVFRVDRVDARLSVAGTF